MDNPKVSIIVPVYNVESYLAQCLDSLIEQTLSDIEILCLDDGSTDGSPELLDAYAGERRSHPRAPSRELRRCRDAQRGRRACARRVILFVDSDDYIAQRTCEVLVATAEREGADIVVFGGKTFPTLPWADDSFAWRDSVYHSGVDALLYERDRKSVV